MDNNNNGRGIFYGVIGVATLVVAVIGATFAYFSASISSGEDIIAANSTSIDLTLTENTTGIKRNLIPVDEAQDGFATGGYVGMAATTTSGPAKNCRDDDGNEFCSMYEFTITNPSATTAQRVYAEMDVKTNTFTTNTPSTAAVIGEDGTVTSSAKCDKLTKTGEEAVYCDKSNFAFAIFKGTADQVDLSSVKWNVDGSAVDTYYSVDSTTGTKNDGTSVATTADATSCDGNVAGTAVLGKNGDMVVARTATKTGSGENIRLAALDQTLRAGGSVTYTVVMWLHENYQDQENDEAQAFAAGITFSTSLGGSGVTAILSTTGTN